MNKQLHSIARSYNSLFIIGLLLFLFSVVVRFVTAGDIDQGGDVLYKWWELRKNSQLNLPLATEPWNHHMMRWSINIPVYFIQNSISKSPAYIYFFPILCSAMSSVFCFLIVQKITQKLMLGVLAGIVFTLLPQNVYAGAQFMPMGPAVLYMLICIYWLLQYLETRKIVFVILAAIFLFCAWGAKVTFIFYFPILLVFLLGEGIFADTYTKQIGYSGFSRIMSGSRAAVIFFLTVSLLFTIETIVLSNITGVEGGRIGTLMLGKHSATHAGQVRNEIDLAEYLTGPIHVFNNVYPEEAANVLLGVGLVISILLLAFRAKQIDRKLLLVILLIIIGFLGHSYATTSVFPFKRPYRFLPRYYLELYTFSLIIGLCVIPLIQQYFKKKIPLSPPLIKIGGCILVLLFVWFGLKVNETAQLARFELENGNNIVEVYKNDKMVQYALTNNISIICPYIATGDGPEWRKYWRFYVLYSYPSNTNFAARAIVHAKMKEHFTLNDGAQYHILLSSKRTPQDNKKYLFTDFGNQYYFIDENGQRISVKI